MHQGPTELNVTRPGITSSVLVSPAKYLVAATPWLTTPRTHWEMFPHNREVDQGLFKELCGILLHASIGTSGSVLGVV